MSKVDTDDLKFCERFVMGKSKRVSFKMGLHFTKGPLGYVHSYLWVFTRTPTRVDVSCL